MCVFIINSYIHLSYLSLSPSIDSSWYLPDYHFAGDLLWGRLAGCAFVNDSCAGWMDWTEDYSRIRTDPFCDGLDYRKGRLGCVDARTAVGPCFAKNYSTDLPKDYQVSGCVCACVCVCVCVYVSVSVCLCP